MTQEKIFLYLRLRSGETVHKRTKIREFAGLGTLLADFRRELITESSPDLGAALGMTAELPTLEYVDANGGEVLISFQVDPAAGEQVISGRIPSDYQGRMLDPEAASFSTEGFVSRAAPELSAEEQASYARRLADNGHDVMTRIREAIDDQGRFELHLPLS